MNERVKFAPAGRCIYCGATEGLSLEHIVPDGLAGRLELPAASCGPCRDNTSDIEKGVLRGALYNLRLKNVPARAKTEKKRPRPKALKGATQTNDGPEIEIDVPVPYLPGGAWAMPSFEHMPGILNGVLPWRAHRPGMEMWLPQQDAERMLKLGPPGQSVKVPLGGTLPAAFAQFLAKVAHGYAYALLGPDGFAPILTDFIRHRTGRAGYWIGARGRNENLRLSDEREIYNVRLIQEPSASGECFLAVTIRFFGYFATPQFIVVVGRPIGEKWKSAIGTCHSGSAPNPLVQAPQTVRPQAPPLSAIYWQKLRPVTEPTDPWAKAT